MGMSDYSRDETANTVPDSLTPASRASGVTADLSAQTSIGLVHGGYFSSLLRAQEFVDLLVRALGDELPKRLRYADFGCGEGFLAKVVTRELQARGFLVETELVDGNPKYLEEAKKTGYACTLTELKEYTAEVPYDLISMRAVHHYNSLEDQELLMVNARRNLTGQGYLVNQLSSGTDVNCRLRTAIINLPSLPYGREANAYHWTSIPEYFLLAAHAGFSNTELVGYAAPNTWTPEELWERVNGVSLKKAEEGADQALQAKILEQKQTYLTEVHAIIERFLKEYDQEHLGVETSGESFLVHYQYPIFVSRK